MGEKGVKKAKKIQRLLWEGPLSTVSKTQKGEQMSCSKEFMHKKAALHLNEWFTLNFFNMPIEKGIKEHYHNADRAFFSFLTLHP